MSEKSTGGPAQPACDNCAGTGGFTLDEWTDPVSGPESYSEKCDVCNGSGKEPVAWAEAQRICDLPIVDEAIRNLLADQTGDNATCMVRAILEAGAHAAEQQEMTARRLLQRALPYIKYRRDDSPAFVAAHDQMMAEIRAFLDSHNKESA